MRKNLLVFTIFLLTILTLSSSVQSRITNDQESDGILFEITGNDLQKPSYLFGTIHIVCPVEMLSMENITSHLAKTDQLILEVTMDDEKELEKFQQDMLLPKNVALKRLLKPVEYAIVDKAFKDYMGVSVNDLAHIKPTYLSYMFISSPKFTGCNNSTSYEETLMGYARNNKKEIIGLETTEVHLKLLHRENYQKDAQDLLKVVTNLDKSTNTTRQMNAIYKSQSSEKLFELLVKELESEKDLQTRLLDDRNIDWLPKIEKAIKERSSFIAVGSGHLGGQNGVVKLLRQKGYTLKAIKL